MTQNDFRLRSLRELLDHLVTSMPVIVISCKPTLDGTLFPSLRGLSASSRFHNDCKYTDLFHMVHVTREDERSILRQVDLENTQAGCMPGCMADL